MSPKRWKVTEPLSRLPRTCGDEPVQVPVASGHSPSAPHLRG